MFYGYNKTSKNWNPQRRYLLARRLSQALNLPIGFMHARPGQPYIDTDNTGLFDNGSTGGVAIRRITHLPEQEVRELLHKADKIYFGVMGGEK